MLRLDKRSEAQIRELIEWVVTHNFWAAACQCPKTLRKSWSKIALQKHLDEKKDVSRANRQWALAQKAQFPEYLKGLYCDEKFCYNRQTSKDLPLSLSEEVFRQNFASIFGGSIR